MTVKEIRHLYDYTEWANELVLSAADKLSNEQLLKDVQISHKSILGTLAHMPLFADELDFRFLFHVGDVLTRGCRQFVPND